MRLWKARVGALATLALLLTGVRATAQEAVASGEAAAPVAEAEIARGIRAAELLALIEEGSPPAILDVRTPEEFAESHIPGAVNILYTELEERAQELGIEEWEELVVYCRTGRRAAIAEATLHELGFTNLRDLEGHISNWTEQGLPLE